MSPIRKPTEDAKTKIPLNDECSDLLSAMLEMLNFLQTEFLRVATEGSLGRGGLPEALSLLSISCLDSLKAALLLCHYDDHQGSGVMHRRFEEFFTVMAYFALVDDGTVLTRWSQMPHLILREKNYKLRSAVAEKMKGFFSRNPIYDFKENFDSASKESVHATRRCAETGFAFAMARYGAMNPGSQTLAALGATLQESHAAMLLGVLGPTVSRLLEFLQRCVFSMPELTGVSPGIGYMRDLDNQIIDCALKVQPLLEKFAKGSVSKLV